jgi:putative DNA primase/helicase
MVCEARGFLEMLFEGKPHELYTLLWILPEKWSHWFRDVQDAIRFAESRREHDLYIGVGLSPRDYGTTHRCPSNEVAGIVGLWADIDVNSDAHAKGALPRTVQDGLEILPKQLPPTFLIRTGNGIHAWWLFREPLIFESEEERCEAASLAKRWQSLLRLNAASRGWAFDCLSDLARLLRVPGTQNCKDPDNPKPVEIHSHSDRRYNPSEFAEFLEDHGIPDPDEQEGVSQAWKKNLRTLPYR